MENFLNVANRWYEKAVDSEDDFDKFISVWISFNAIYGQKNGRERQKITKVINELDDASIRRILDLEEVTFFQRISPPIRFYTDDGMGDTDQSQKALNRNFNQNPRKALEALMYILNKVRNNLFHGSKRLGQERDVETVRNAYPIVREIIQYHLGIHEPREQVRIRQEQVASTSVFASLGAVFHKKSIELEEDLANFTIRHTIIPKDRDHHPVSILLDRHNVGANGWEANCITPELMSERLDNLLQHYEEKKPQAIKDMEDVYRFVTTRIREVIANGCMQEDLDRLNKEYLEVQQKYLSKGYLFKI